MSDVENIISASPTHSEQVDYTNALQQGQQRTFTSQTNGAVAGVAGVSGSSGASGASGAPGGPGAPPMLSEAEPEDAGVTDDDIQTWLKARQRAYNENQQRRDTTLQAIRDAMMNDENERALRDRVSMAHLGHQEQQRLRKMSQHGADLTTWFDFVRNEAAQLQSLVPTFGTIAREMPLPQV